MNNKGYFVTGIGTGVGKTIVSAVLCKALGADYFKPLQCGELDAPETEKISSLVPGTYIHPTLYALREPVSPHRAARMEGVEICLDRIQLPQSDRIVIVEGAGGLLVPLNDTETIADLAYKLNLPLVLVVNHYLGSLNHTLLSLEYIRSRKLPFAGIIFNGQPDAESERIIGLLGRADVLGSVAHMDKPNPEQVAQAAANIKIV